MKKRIWSLLSFLLIAAMLFSSYTVSGAEKSAEETTRIIRNIFYAVETGGQVYGKCRYDDVTAAYTASANETAITIGAGQWLGNEAKELLELIQTTDPDLFSQLDAAGIASDLEMDSWKYYDIDPDGEKGKCIAAIISSDVGKKCQDQKMDEQIQYYLETAEDAGITDLGGQVMYAETMHCGGKSAANRILGHTEKPYNAENYYKALTTTWPEDSGFNSPISGSEGSTYYMRHTKIYGWVQEYLLNDAEDDVTSGGSTENSGSASDSSSGSKTENASEQKTYWKKTSSGKWYLYDSDGNCLTGWQYVNGKWYYLSETDGGVMRYGWQKIDGKWYYLGGCNDGAMRSGWQKIDGTWYYFGGPDDGAMRTGWQTVYGKTYYLASDGAMKAYWQQIDGKWYYFGTANDGAMRTGWQTVYGKKYYLGSDGVMRTYWKNVDGKWYYFGTANDGAMRTGWQTVYSKKYYLGSDGVMRTYWQNVDGKWYYFGTANDGAMKTGWQTVYSKKYYLGSDGVMRTGWQKLDGKWYYFGGSSDGAMKTGWQKLDGKTYYFGEANDGIMKTGWQKISDKWYYFYSDGHMAADTYIGDYYVDENGVWVEESATENLFTDVAGGQRTIKNLLQNAMKPVGSTLYIWGGGHDTGTGGDGKRYGVNPQWKTFYDSQNASYDYEDYLYSYGNGLDCSGFVGWAVYNTVYTKSNQSWSTTTSYYMASTLAGRNYAGTGKTGGTLLEDPTSFKPGDVVSMNGHTYIVIGQCSDGSLVLVHATPPAVQISGTITPDGNWNSEARQLAQSYMKKYYPDWYFTSQGCGLSYLKGSSSYPLQVNRWTTDGSGIFTDPDQYQNMSAREVLADLFNE